MSKILEGNGNGNGANGLLHPLQTRTLPPPADTPAYESVKNRVAFQTHDGVKQHGVPVRITRQHIVFEVFSPGVVLRLSEVLDKFTIVLQGRMVYSGRAVISNVMDAGAKTMCVVSLDEAKWTDLNQILALRQEERVANEFRSFLRDWQKFYTILPEFKIVIADMQSFLYDLRLWLERVELQIHASPATTRGQTERKVIDQLAGPIVQGIDAFIERFESIAAGLDADFQPAHCAFLRRQLHPLVLCSPFAYRAFCKPLGYPGDYQMVDMMLRPPYEGNTLFAKIINFWLLGQSPTQAHRNRITRLVHHLKLETYRVTRAGGKARIFNFACGPAVEVQRFLADFQLSEQAELTLADFNQETLDHVAGTIGNIKERLSLETGVHFQKKSVYQALKESTAKASRKSEYDFVYCAGLFDYLPDATGKRLVEVFYDWLAPGGLLLVTNATDALNSSRPFRFSMEYILDWHLIYRNKVQLASLAPHSADKDYVNVVAEDIGTNLFLEIRKPNHV